MRRISYRPYFFLLLFFMAVLSLPQSTSARLRSAAVGSLSPFWRGMQSLKESTVYLFSMPFVPMVRPPDVSLEIDRLSQENQLLRSQVENVREWLLQEDRIQDQVKRLQSVAKMADTDAIWRDFFIRRSEELCQAIDLQVRSVPARVIFREPASWSSSLWINLGEKDNQKLGKKVIAQNSPVLLGTSIIGVIEYVGNNQSRVRLITDSSLVPSVRAVRGKEQNRYLLEHLEAMQFALEMREDLFATKEEAASMQAQLAQLKGALMQRSGNLYLAKGELHGSGRPLWRSRNQVLKGIGFNYDYSDEEGPARDLRSGEPYDPARKKETLALLRPGDLLVTTGLDGVFPPGFRVATVSSVQTLKEGASSYEIEAISTAGSLDEISHVFVLSRLEQE